MKRTCKRMSSLLVAGVAAYGGLSQFGDSTRDVAEAAGKPNILFIILDDVGIDQMKLFGFGGEPAARMPNIAKIASKGVKFTNVWAMPECSPSRAAFFTGRYPLRTGVDSAIVGNHLPQEYMSEYEATLPRVLAKAGYVSSMIGKYHLGNEKDPAGNCAPSTRGWHQFVGNMTPGPPSIDKTAGGADPSGSQVCGYIQTSDPGSCYTQKSGNTQCKQIDASNAAPNTSPSRTCLQGGGLFRPNTACGDSVPTADDFAKTNAYYVWSQSRVIGPRSPQWVAKKEDACAPVTKRSFMTEAQSTKAGNWWNKQTGARMMTLSFNSIHTPFQKAATNVVADPKDRTSTCSPLLTERTLINNMLEAADVEIGRLLADIGLGTLDAEGRKLTSLHLGNTVVIVVGDNGSYGSTVRVTDGFDVSRSKASVYQTGVWVPLIVAGPMVAEPGRDVDEMINVTDMFQLFGDIAGVDVKEIVPPAHQLDSKPMLPYLTTPGTVAIRETNFTQLAAGKFTPDPAERSWPCLQGNTCNDTLLFNRNLCEDNGGVWYGPGGATQVTSCCAVAAMNSGVSVNPVAQWAVRNKRYKLVELLKTNCAAPLPPNATNKPFPWAEYDTQTSREFYDLRKTQGNPTGVDFADNNLLRDCPAGQDPKTCLEGPLRRNYTQLSNTLASVRGSGDAQATCMSKGDGNLDLRVNNADVRAWRVLNGKGPSQYDINRDAETNEDDLAIIQANLGADCMDVCARADLNRDGKVDRRDMSLLSKQSGACDEVMCGGDLDGNGAVNNRDVNLMINAQNTCTP